MTLADARAFDESKYPEWYGQWTRPNGVGNQWDPTKPGGPAQQAPLKPEYQAIYEANLADQKTGGQGTDPLFRCLPPGMPRQMTVVFPMEVLFMQGNTYMAFGQGKVFRRIYPDAKIIERAAIMNARIMEFLPARTARAGRMRRYVLMNLQNGCRLIFRMLARRRHQRCR
jgi:hypothetical protein